MKVYCWDCKHIYAIVKCQHPKNLYYKDTAFNREIEKRDMPLDLNKDNNCKWYEETWLKKMFKKKSKEG